MSHTSIDLAPNEMILVKQIINQYVPDHEVRVFGSRATHTAKKFSDLDLVIMTTSPLSFDVLGNIIDAFKNSELPIKVDTVDWSRISDEFRAQILKNSIVFPH